MAKSKKNTSTVNRLISAAKTGVEVNRASLGGLRNAGFVGGLKTGADIGRAIVSKAGGVPRHEESIKVRRGAK
jgi:hypothetical protein